MPIPSPLLRSLSLFSLLGFFLVGTTLSAQEAEIHGKVTDATGEPLSGATVAAVGAVVGAFTDDEGHYELEVAAGKIRLVISYIGYENFDTTFTVAVSDREIEINAVLTDAFSDLPETQVIARRAVGQAQALRLQQSGLCTQTIIHSETFNKYPDVTLAETVSRMPGVSMIRDVSRGQLVQLRGLPERYTGVSLNGQRLPNVQPEDDQSGGLDIIQSNLVEEVRIIKSRTAEIDGDAIAGMVDFRIRQPEERFELLAQAAQGVNVGFNDNPGQFRGVTQLAG
ncbi:MAG: carboxypeptidase-like regulatory domain-containing protein, partial [Bacteroidota bacterium]